MPFSCGSALAFVWIDLVGKGLYQASTGGIVVRYHEALKAVGFRPFAGANAKWQSPDVPSSVLRLLLRRLMVRMRMMCRPAPV